MENYTLVGLGKSMHRFTQKECTKPCMIGGIYIEELPGFATDTDGDVVFEALCLAIESISTYRLSETLEASFLKEGITDSELFLKKALEYIEGRTIANIAISLEGKAPWLSNTRKLAIQEKLASICAIPFYRIGITHTSADGLNECGLGQGFAATALITVQ